jgi:hypothetical protein
VKQKIILVHNVHTQVCEHRVNVYARMLLLKTQQLSQDMNTFIDPVISDLHTGQVVTLTLQIEHITR